MLFPYIQFSIGTNGKHWSTTYINPVVAVVAVVAVVVVLVVAQIIKGP